MRKYRDEGEKRTLFSDTNPPTDTVAAKERLKLLETAMGLIESDLKLLDPEKDFYSMDDYDDWRADAIIAHGHKNAERNFLLRWLLQAGSEGYTWSISSALRSILPTSRQHKVVAAE